jgi:DNA-directed RNA polymerase specialized sigma24 family protein
MDARSESLANISIESSYSDFDDVFRAHYPRIARVIARIVHDPGRAEELAATCF